MNRGRPESQHRFGGGGPEAAARNNKKLNKNILDTQKYSSAFVLIVFFHISMFTFDNHRQFLICTHQAKIALVYQMINWFLIEYDSVFYIPEHGDELRAPGGIVVVTAIATETGGDGGVEDIVFWRDMPRQTIFSH